MGYWGVQILLQQPYFLTLPPIYKREAKSDPRSSAVPMAQVSVSVKASFPSACEKPFRHTHWLGIQIYAKDV